MKMRQRSGFSLVEMLVVVVIAGILIGYVYTTFESGRSAMDSYITYADLWQDMDDIMDQLTLTARSAHTISVKDDGRSVDFLDRDDAVVASASFDENGVFTLQRTGFADNVLTRRVDAGRSSFVQRGASLEVRLTLADSPLARRIDIGTSTEIFPRN